MPVGVALGLLVVMIADATAADPYVVVANYGLLGAVAIAFFTGRVVSAKQYEQALADRDREHGELVALRVKTEEQFIPAIIRNTELMVRLVEKTG